MRDHRIIAPPSRAIRTVYPCRRCVHYELCETLFGRLGEALDAERREHPVGYELPTVCVDCEGRFTPPSRFRPVKVS